MILTRTNHHDNTDIYRFTENGKELTVLSVQKNDPQLNLMADNTFMNQADSLRYLQYINEQLTVQYHPESILFQNAEPRYHRILNGCAYYAKGHDFLRKTDPWRLRLKDRVFDEYGYIIDQGRMQDIPFGWFSTREKGCGWIAAYNLLRLNGIELPIDQVVKELSDKAFLGEVIGADIYTLHRYLRKKGIPVHLTFPLDADSLPKIQKSRSGIILYHHAYGAHYCAYEKTEDNRLHFYNAVYGRRYHYDTLQHFMKTFEFLPFTMAIVVL